MLKLFLFIFSVALCKCDTRFPTASEYVPSVQKPSSDFAQSLPVSVNTQKSSQPDVIVAIFEYQYSSEPPPPNPPPFPYLSPHVSQYPPPPPPYHGWGHRQNRRFPRIPPPPPPPSPSHPPPPPPHPPPPYPPQTYPPPPYPLPPYPPPPYPPPPYSPPPYPPPPYPPLPYPPSPYPPPSYPPPSHVPPPPPHPPPPPPLPPPPHSPLAYYEVGYDKTFNGHYGYSQPGPPGPLDHGFDNNQDKKYGNQNFKLNSEDNQEYYSEGFNHQQNKLPSVQSQEYNMNDNYDSNQNNRPLDQISHSYGKPSHQSQNLFNQNNNGYSSKPNIFNQGFASQQYPNTGVQNPVSNRPSNESSQLLDLMPLEDQVGKVTELPYLMALNPADSKVEPDNVKTTEEDEDFQIDVRF